MITSKDCIAKYGNPTPEFERKWMTLFEIYFADYPFNNLPKKIYCNRDILAPLQQALKNLLANGCAKELKTWDGCFAVRKSRTSGNYSLHSWGVAVDVNASENGLGKQPVLSADFVRSFKEAGFSWGGDWHLKDGMHFQISKI